MPADATLDLDEIGRAAGNLSGDSVALDLDSIGRSVPPIELIGLEEREQRKQRLRQEKNLAAIEGSRAGAFADFADLFFKGSQPDVPVPDKTLEGGIPSQIGLGLTSGVAQLGQSGAKLLETMTRSGVSVAPEIRDSVADMFRGWSDVAGQAGREVEQLGQQTQGPDMVRHVAGGLVSMAPAAVAAPFGLPAAIVAVGLHSFSSTLANAEEAYRAQGLSDQDARRKALWPALATGVGTALVTRGFGATGIESWTKAISSGAFRETLKEIAKAAGLEATEEFYDQVQTRLWEEFSYRPSANFRQALERTLEESSLAGLSGGIASGLLRTVTAGRGLFEPSVTQADLEKQQLDAAFRTAQETGPAQAPPIDPGATFARRIAASFAQSQGIPVGTAQAVAPKILPQDTRITVQAQQGEVPGFIQIDLVQNGESIRSTNPETLRAEGYTLPDFSTLPQGRYTFEEATRLLTKTTKGASDASTIRSDQTKPAQAGKTDETGKTDSGSDVQPGSSGQPGGTVVPPAQTPSPERITLRNNIAGELPEFTLEAMRRGADDPHTGRTFPASVIFNPRDKAVLFVKGPSQHYSYKIPLSEIPHEIIKGGLSFDKQAVLNWLNDPVKRFSARNTSRKAEHFSPDDITEIAKVTGKPGRPAKQPGGAGDVRLDQPAGGTTKHEKVTKPKRRGMLDITRRAFEDLRARNPNAVEQLLSRRPEELDDLFWANIRDEIAKLPEFQDKPPEAADVLAADLRRLKDGGELEWQASITDLRYGKTFGEPMGDIETDNLREARRLVDDPNSGLTEEQKSVLRDILDSPIAGYLNGRQIRFRIADSVGQGVSGIYDPVAQMIAIARGSDALTGAHEFFHPLWEMIQDGDRRNVREWRYQALDRAMQGATGKDLGDLQMMAAGELSSRDFIALEIDPKFYRLRSTEEFFAEMMTERFQRDRQGVWGQAKEILSSQDAFLSKIRKILDAIFDSLRRRIPGFTREIEQLQQTILSGKYDVLPVDRDFAGEVVGEALRKNQAALDADFERSKEQGSKVIASAPGETEIELDINKQQMMALVGPQMYSKPIVEVAAKELLQNAFDTVRSAGATPENPGIIDIKTDSYERTLSVKDNGTGMTPEIIRKAFFTIGGTYKTGSLENTSGGLGLAKMAFILGSEHIRVESVKDGLKSVVDADSNQIRNSKFAIKTERTGEPNGTTVTVKIPEKYRDAYGEEKSIYFNSYPSFLNEPLIGPVKVTFNGAELPIGVNLKNWQKENQFDFGWGRIDLHVLPTEKTDYPKIRVLSAGLKQFDISAYDLFGWGSEPKIHYNLILDVRPRVKTDNAAYPFNNQREGWRATIKEDVDAMYSFLKRMAVEQQLLQAKGVFTGLRQLDKMDPMKDWSPEEIADFERRYQSGRFRPPPTVGKPKEVERVDFRGPDVIIQYKDGTETRENKEEYVKKTFAAKRDIDLKKTEIDVSQMDPTIPNLHNNVSVTFDDIPGAGTLITETGNILLKFMREWGKKVGGGYEDLANESITGWFGGISFDKNYRGLNMVLPMKAIWFNLGLLSSEGRQSPAAAAAEALHIFIHEITHVVARTEGSDFTAELANNYARIRSKDIPIELFEGTLDKIFATNWEAFNEINDRLQNYNTKNSAESFRSAAELGPERPGGTQPTGPGTSPVNAPRAGGVPEQGPRGAGRTGPPDRVAGSIGDILSGKVRAERSPGSISRERGIQGALESREKVEEYIRPLEETVTPQYYRGMASVINKGLIPRGAAERFAALPEGVRQEMSGIFGDRIGTHQEGGRTFAEIMADQNITPEQKADYARNAITEWIGYQADKLKIINRRDTTIRDLEAATLKAIDAIPETNEADLRAVNSLGRVLDRIKAERERTAEGAVANERIREGRDNIHTLNELLSHPRPTSMALGDIARLVGRARLNAERPGENVLELISEASGFDATSMAIDLNNPGPWVRALAAHLSQMENAEGRPVVRASQPIIEGVLWMLRQVGDFRQELHEARMTEDGTLRRFNADYLNDLRSTTPRGFNTILREYATHQKEADALRSASNRLERKIVALGEKRDNLTQAVDFLTAHDADPEFTGFGKAMQETTGAISGVEHTDTGAVVTYVHPLTGENVRIDHGFDKAESLENIQRMKALADAGLEYGRRPDANPIKKAFWESEADRLADYITAGPHRDRLEDPILDPVKRLLSSRRFALIAETSLSRIPGVLANITSRALEAFGHALKAKNAFEKDHEQRLINANLRAWRSHKRPGEPDVATIRQWRDEISGPIIDSRQHFGQKAYRVGDRIVGFGHLITAEDMKAVEAQYGYDQYLIKLAFKSGYVPAVAEAPGRIKDVGLGILRFALSQGPGTTTRFLSEETRRLPDQWKAVVEGGRVDQFLNAGDNFVRLVLGHVMEDERNYFQLGQGRFARDYKFMREQRQALQRSGEMPTNIDDLSQYVANLHNQHLAEGEAPATSGDVRTSLIDDVTRYMNMIRDDNAKKQTASRVDIISYENEYTQPRGGKIAPGTLYRYGTTDRVDMIRKGNNAVEFYVINYRDRLRQLQDALLEEKQKLLKTLNEVYGGEGVSERRELARGIKAGNNPTLQRHQMTMEEVNRNIDRVGKLLNNAKDILRRREEFYGDDIANRLFSPWLNLVTGSVLLGPMTMIRNASGGMVMWALKTADVRRGGWIGMPFAALKDNIRTFVSTVQRRRVPKGERERIANSLMNDFTQPATELAAGILRDVQDREQLRRSGVIDSYNLKDGVGWDSDLPLSQIFKALWDTSNELRVEPSLSVRKEIYNRLGMLPRSWMLLARKIGQRPIDNWINVRAISFGNAIADSLRVRAIRAFDNRLESDPVFQQLYREYGDNFKRFELNVLAAAAESQGAVLTPSELTGRLDVPGGTIDKAAIQLRRMFDRNNDPVDRIMLKYWWNQRNANGDRNAPFMTQAQRLALQFVLAEDTNMGTPATRPTYFMGSKNRQILGVLNQWWLWNADKLSEITAKVRGQKTIGVRYAPALMGFVLTTALAAVIAESLGRKANEMAYGTVSSNPDISNAETDEERLKIIASIAANYWGAVGSVVKYFTDTPGKLGYRNPIFYLNLLTDLMGTAGKIYQSGDLQGPTLDIIARYNPVLRAVINRLPAREGLVDVRNAANALRAATPDSLEAKRRQPVSGADLRATPMTPLYNAILNAAAQGDWATADEAFARAVEQARAAGNPNPEGAIVAAIRTRAPEASVFQRMLTDEERAQVYGRLSATNLAQVEKTNQVFEEIASRYGGTGGGGGGGTRLAGIGGRSVAAASLAPSAGFRELSLGAPRGVRSGFRTRSLRRRGLRTRSLLRTGLRRPRLRSRLRRLAV